jgi:inosine/xanthosine triphosphate pyrophosphatase family protein
MDLLDDAGLHPYTLDVFPGDKFKRFHIEGVLASYAPFIASIRSSRFSTHAVLILGIEGDRLFYHDPWEGAHMSMTLDRLNDSAVCASVTTATAHHVAAM